MAATPIIDTAMNCLSRLLVLFSLLVWLPVPSALAEEALSFKEQLERANELIKSYRHFEACEALKEATKQAGDKHPSLHMRLAILYYGLGLIPEAIAEGEKAVALSPSSKWYRYDLAKFYYVYKQHAKAEQQFFALLTQDPGFTLGYYYLAELYFRNKNYDMAWLSLQRARLLGFQGMDLEKKLAPLSKKPLEDFATVAQESMLFRFIKVGSEQEANDILTELHNGKLFENFELELKKEKAEEAEFGVLDIRETTAPLTDLLRGQQLFAPPVLVVADSEYRIVQRIAPFSKETWRSIAASTRSRGKEAYTPAAASTSSPPSILPYPPAEPSSAPPAISASAELRHSREQEHLSLQLEAYYALESWKNAWQAADVDSYLAAYSTQFTPTGKIPLAIWKDKRKASLTQPRYIRLKIENPVVELQAENRLKITFTQHYASENYSDSVRKALIMERENNRWKIREELILEVIEE